MRLNDEKATFLRLEQNLMSGNGRVKHLHKTLSKPNLILNREIGIVYDMLEQILTSD